MDELSKFWSKTVESIKNNNESIIPITALTVVFGGTIVYIWRNRRKENILKSKTKSVLQIEVLELPPEARKQIWERLPYTDLLKLRFVSSTIKDDVDNLIGLKMTIAKRVTDKYEFCQKVALQSCIILDFDGEISENFLVDPYLMKKLEIFEKSQMSLSNMVNILSPCVNLTHLKLHINYSTNISEISEIVLQLIGSMENLAYLQLSRMTINPIQEKAFPVQTAASSFPCPKRLQYIQLEVPDLSDDQVSSWRFLLEQQTNLRVLLVNVGAVYWEYFRKIVTKNVNLESVGFLGLKNYRIDSEDNKPFDWGIFSKCEKLLNVEITCSRTLGRRGTENLQAINFHKLPCQSIQSLLVSHVTLSPADVSRIYLEMTNLKRGSLNNIGDEAIARAAEIAAQQFQQFRDGTDENWFNSESYWIIHYSLIAFSLVAAITFASQPYQKLRQDDLADIS